VLLHLLLLEALLLQLVLGLHHMQLDLVGVAPPLRLGPVSYPAPAVCPHSPPVVGLLLLLLLLLLLEGVVVVVLYLVVVVRGGGAT
jgi:hypothetical protein